MYICHTYCLVSCLLPCPCSAYLQLQKHEPCTTSWLNRAVRSSSTQAEDWSNVTYANAANAMVAVAFRTTVWVPALSMMINVVQLLFGSQGVWSFLRPLLWYVCIIRKQGMSQGAGSQL